MNFLRAARVALPGRKFDVIFMAPANTYKDTAAFLREGSAPIGNFRMFGIGDSTERRDHMFWELAPQLAGLYPGSLLFFVSRSVETRRNMPILGLQRDYATPSSGAAREDNLEVRRSLLDLPGRVVWSPCQGPAGFCTNCSSHGDFCSDSLTLQSLRYLIRNSNW